MSNANCYKCTISISGNLTMPAKTTKLSLKGSQYFLTPCRIDHINNDLVSADIHCEPTDRCNKIFKKECLDWATDDITRQAQKLALAGGLEVISDENSEL
jgi:hypothetical protein